MNTTTRTRRLRRLLHGLFCIACALLPFLAASAVAQAQERLEVVCSHSALGSIAAQVGGDRVHVTSIATGAGDVHAVEAKPSVFAELAEADVFVHSGLDLELWVKGAIDGSRNPRIRPEQPGNVDASAGIKLLNVPQTPSRAQGDVHIYGNPHYWMDPVNAKAIAGNVEAGFAAVDPAGADAYREGREAFCQDIDRLLMDLLRKALKKKGAPIVVYHDSFPYFVRRFGLVVAGTVEPKPRIAPTQGHLLELIETIEERQVRVIVREPFHPEAATEFLAERSGAKVVTLTTLPGGVPGSDTYQAMIERDLMAILEALP